MPQSRESLRRMVFNKDHDKLLKFLVPYPQNEEIISGGNISSPPEILFTPTRPVMFRGISSGSVTGQLKLDTVADPSADHGPLFRPWKKLPAAGPINIRPIALHSSYVKIVPKPRIPASKIVVIPTNNDKMSQIPVSVPRTISSTTEIVVPKSLNKSETVTTVTPTQPLTSVLTSPCVASEPTMSYDNNVNSVKVIVKSVKCEDFQDALEYKEEEEEDVNYFRCGNNGKCLLEFYFLVFSHTLPYVSCRTASRILLNFIVKK